MEIGLCTWVRVHPAKPHDLQDAYRQFFEQSILAEELGFDEVWLSEHHFARDAWNPSQFLSWRHWRRDRSGSAWEPMSRCCRCTTRSGLPRTPPP